MREVLDFSANTQVFISGCSRVPYAAAESNSQAFRNPQDVADLLRVVGSAQGAHDMKPDSQ